MHYWPDKDDQSVVTEMLNDPQSPEWGKCRAFLLKKCIKKGYPELVREDIVQETLIKVLRYLATFAYQYPLAAWLGIVLTTTAIDFARKERKGKANVSLEALQDADEEKLEIAIETSTPEDDTITHEKIREAITGYLKALKGRRNAERDFDVWRLHVLLGQEAKRIADYLKIDIQIVYRIIRQAKEHFSRLRRKKLI